MRHGLTSLFLDALEDGRGWTYEQMGVLRERTWAVRGRRGAAFVTLRGADAARLERVCGVRGWTRGDVARVAVWYLWELYVGLDRVSLARFGGTA